MTKLDRPTFRDFINNLESRIGVEVQIGTILWNVAEASFFEVQKAFDQAERLYTNLPTGLNSSIVDHSSHDVVENVAGGKTFKYCRVCKTEVL